MTDPNNSKQGGRSSLVGVLAGSVLGFIAGAFVMNVVGQGAMEKKAQDALGSSKLVPVVVAAQDIPEDTVVTFDHIQQRSVPEQLATSSVVKPESAQYIVNAKLLVPVQAGDMLLWSQFESKRNKSNESAPVGDTQVK